MKLQGNCTDKTRMVIMNRYGAVVPVMSATRKTLDDGSFVVVNTYQDLERSRLVYSSELKDDGSVELNVTKFERNLDEPIIVEDIPEQHVYEKSTLLSKAPSAIIEWLKQVGNPQSPNCLPEGYGWDGIHTHTEIYKSHRVRDLLLGSGERVNMPDDWVRNVMSQAIPTSARFIKTKWEEAEPLPLRINALPIHNVDSVDIIYCYDSPVCKHVRERVRKVVGATEHYAGIDIPSDVNRAILIKYGVMVGEDGQSYGVQIELYQRDL